MISIGIIKSSKANNASFDIKHSKVNRTSFIVKYLKIKRASRVKPKTEPEALKQSVTVKYSRYKQIIIYK